MYFLTFETNGAPLLHDVCGRDKAALYAILYGAARAEISRPPFTNGCRCFAVSGEIFCAETRSAPLPILLRSRQGARHSLPCKRAAYAAAIATTTLRSRSGGNKPTAVPERLSVPCSFGRDILCGNKKRAAANTLAVLARRATRFTVQKSRPKPYLRPSGSVIYIK